MILHRLAIGIIYILTGKKRYQTATTNNPQNHPTTKQV